MKFIGKGLVWDAVNNRVLCKFEKGELETNDKHVIDTLVSAGYEHEGELDEDEENSDTTSNVDNQEDIPTGESIDAAGEEPEKKSSRNKGAK